MPKECFHPLLPPSIASASPAHFAAVPEFLPSTPPPTMPSYTLHKHASVIAALSAHRLPAGSGGLTCLIPSSSLGPFLLVPFSLPVSHRSLSPPNSLGLALSPAHSQGEPYHLGQVCSPICFPSVSAHGQAFPPCTPLGSVGFPRSPPPLASTWP